MLKNKPPVCRKCGQAMKYYDTVQRIVRTKNRKTEWVKVKRFRCTVCSELHRNLPTFLLPYKQYETEVIKGVLEGLITSETLGYEDYPCEMTMIRWKKARELQLLL